MRILVTGGGGMISGFLVKHLLDLGHKVRATDIKPFDSWWQIDPRAESVENVDLTYCSSLVWQLFRHYDMGWHTDIDWVFHLASNMGGIAQITAQDKQAGIIHDNTMMDAIMLQAAIKAGASKFFFSSSACVYPTYRMMEVDYEPLAEQDVYPAQCNEGYGWSKLHTEHMLLAHRHLIDIYIARFQNVYGPRGSWNDGKEKVPAAMCRKIAEAKLKGESSIEVWGDGEQERGFMYVEDCVRAITDLVETDCHEPITLGPEWSVSINDLVDIISEIADYPVEINHISGPEGVRSRHFDHARRKMLGLTVDTSVWDGMRRLYEWVEEMVNADQ